MEVIISRVSWTYIFLPSLVTNKQKLFADEFLPTEFQEANKHQALGLIEFNLNIETSVSEVWDVAMSGNSVASLPNRRRITINDEWYSADLITPSQITWYIMFNFVHKLVEVLNKTKSATLTVSHGAHYMLWHKIYITQNMISGFIWYQI